MKILLKIGIIISILSVIQACDKVNTHGKFLTEHEDGWFDGYAPGGKPAYSEIDREEEADEGLVYCMANVSNDKAKPICYRPQFTGKVRR